MARIYVKKTSRVEHICGHGGHVIPKGDGYYAAAPGFRGREVYRCLQHPFRPSELVSGLRSQPMAALEALEDSIGDLETGDYDGLKGLLSDFASEVRSYADERQTALDAWENGNSMLEELLDTAENAASEAEDIENEVDEYDEEEPQASDFEDTEDYEQALEEWEQGKVDHWEETTSNALDRAQSIEF